MYKKQHIRSCTNKQWSKLFKGALKSKVNHSKRLKVLDRGHRSTYSACICDNPLLKASYITRIIYNNGYIA